MYVFTMFMLERNLRFHLRIANHTVQICMEQELNTEGQGEGLTNWSWLLCVWWLLKEPFVC